MQEILKENQLLCNVFLSALTLPKDVFSLCTPAVASKKPGGLYELDVN